MYFIHFIKIIVLQLPEQMENLQHVNFCMKFYLLKNLNVKLVGNIGNPILSEKKFKKTIFIIEASSYQLEYSKIFKSKYAAILNLSPDHIERHKTINNYVKAKFKLLKNQLKII